MTSLRQNVSVKCFTDLPTDMIIEILSRLPAKSLEICRCVSKQWTSILRSSLFIEAVLNKSTSQPQLLLVCQNKNDECLFYSTIQPHNPGDNLLPLAASYLYKVSLPYITKLAFSPIRGLVFISDVKDKTGSTWIYNPSTWRILYLPELSPVQMFYAPQSYIGYDPTEKQYKILASTRVTHVHYRGTEEVEVESQEYQVLTIGTGKLTWRTIECCIRHRPLHSGICIDGVLYYPADNDRFMWPDCSYMVVCFDVRSEKFRSVKVTETFIKEVGCNGILINYNGKFAALVALGSKYVNGRTTSFKLWVLEEVEKEEWSEHTYVLSALCRNTFRNKCLRFVGVTRTKEIVLSSHHQNRKGPFYIYYYNIEKGTVVRVGIQGINKGFKGNKVNIYLDHVQDLR